MRTVRWGSVTVAEATGRTRRVGTGIPPAPAAPERRTPTRQRSAPPCALGAGDDGVERGRDRGSRPRGEPRRSRCRAADRAWRSSAAPRGPTARCRRAPGLVVVAAFEVSAHADEAVAPRRPMMTTGRSLPCVGSSSYGTHVHTTSPGSASPSRIGVYSMSTPPRSRRRRARGRRPCRPAVRRGAASAAASCARLRQILPPWPLGSADVAARAGRRRSRGARRGGPRRRATNTTGGRVTLL